MFEAGKWAIGVDTDQWISIGPPTNGAILTSAQKAIDVSVLDVISKNAGGDMGGEDYVGTLANNGVLLAPFHDFDDEISAELKAEIEALRAAIVAGSVKVCTLPRRAAARQLGAETQLDPTRPPPARTADRGRSASKHHRQSRPTACVSSCATSRKRFPGVLANDKISISADRGKVLGLLGENGAGKTTLMNILSGLYKPDSGQILIDGEERVFGDPAAAIEAGVGMVHQHFMLVPVFDVVEAVALGAETVSGPLGTFDRAAARRRIVELSEQYKLDVNPDAKIESLPVGVRQRVEILKALYRHSDILVLDEPSAVLTPYETEELFGIIRSLDGERHDGHLHHPQAQRGARGRRRHRRAAPRPRRRHGGPQDDHAPGAGQHDGRARRRADRAEGPREARRRRPQRRGPASSATTAWRWRSTASTSRSGRARSSRIAGVQGNGQTELVEAITGLRAIDSGEITIGGMHVEKATPRQVSDLGVAHIPEDRGRDGLIAYMTIAENYILDTYHREPYSKRGIFDLDAVNERGRAGRQGLRHPDAVDPHARRRRCRAGTSRRSSWRASSPCRSSWSSPPSRPAASTSARSSTSTAGSSSSATPAPRS